MARESLRLGLPIFVAEAILIAFPFTWLYHASGAAILVLSLFHSSFDVWGDTFTSPVAYPGQKQLLVGDTGLICLLLLSFIVILKYFAFDVRIKSRDN